MSGIDVIYPNSGLKIFSKETVCNGMSNEVRQEFFMTQVAEERRVSPEQFTALEIELLTSADKLGLPVNDTIELPAFQGADSLVEWKEHIPGDNRFWHAFLT